MIFKRRATFQLPWAPLTSSLPPIAVQCRKTSCLHHPSPSPSPRKGVALITGALRGIGYGIALRLAENGYDIAANGQTGTVELDNVVKEIEEKGRRALAIPGDVSEESVVEDMIQCTVSTLGNLDVVRTIAPSVFAIFEPACDALLIVSSSR
jgi:short chain dehydrogenase